MNVLDNPVWHSICDTHLALASVSGTDGARAGCFHRDVSPFGGLEDPRDPRSWQAFADLIEGGTGVLVVDPGHVPAGWEIVAEIPGVQMDGSGMEPAPDPEVVPLGTSDVGEVLDLVGRTRPGPYLQRTIEMGDYIGVRNDAGALVAMAGERLQPAGWTEISAVCTDGRYRGRGLGGRLVRAVGAGIRAKGRVPCLHAASDNVNAIRLYEALGFSIRRTCTFTIVREQRAA